MTIAHTGIKTPDPQHAAVVAWYEAALAPLGYTKSMTFLDGLVVGFKDTITDNIDWWVSSAAAVPPDAAPAGETEGDQGKIAPVHTAFVAKDRASVDAFHQAAVAAGGKCNGPPGLRAHYGPGYYAAFVLDPVGNNIEAACNSAV
ncbi:VOC domain-containing protein [Madurella fahalii]|uniref:VOC domain-containing protein n=1 Tax=Madurella fahalii TaxID=1157608 RepID=A0ABQ0GGR2_9PEZI